MKNLLSVLVVIGLLGVAAYFMMGKDRFAMTRPTPTPVTTAPSTSPSTTSSSEALMMLEAGGSSFRDPNGQYSFLYPNDYVLDTQDSAHVRIYKTGPTQTGQTEMYDGVLMVFEVVDLEGKTLEQWVDTRIADSTSDGAMELIEAKTATTIHSYPAFTYTVDGFGSSKYYVIAKDASAKSAIVIATLVSDPAEKDFQTQVDAILQTVTLY